MNDIFIISNNLNRLINIQIIFNVSIPHYTSLLRGYASHQVINNLENAPNYKISPSIIINQKRSSFRIQQ